MIILFITVSRLVSSECSDWIFQACSRYVIHILWSKGNTFSTGLQGTLMLSLVFTVMVSFIFLRVFVFKIFVRSLSTGALMISTWNLVVNTPTIEPGAISRKCSLIHFLFAALRVVQKSININWEESYYAGQKVWHLARR